MDQASIFQMSLKGGQQWWPPRGVLSEKWTEARKRHFSLGRGTGEGKMMTQRWPKGLCGLDELDPFPWEGSSVDHP